MESEHLRGSISLHDNRLCPLHIPKDTISSLFWPIVTSSPHPSEEEIHVMWKKVPPLTSGLDPPVWALRKFPEQIHFEVIWIWEEKKKSQKHTSIWEFERAALPQCLSWKGDKSTGVFLGYSLTPMGGHETSLCSPPQVTQTFPALGTNSQTCFLLHSASSLLRGRDTPCTSSPTSRSCQMSNSTDHRWTHTSRCIPISQSFRHGTVQKHSPDTMPAQSFIARSVPYRASASESRLWLNPTRCYLK